MSSFIQLFLHHDDPAQNGADAPTLHEALQRFVDDVRDSGHRVTAQPTINGQPLALDINAPTTETSVPAETTPTEPTPPQKGT